MASEDALMRRLYFGHLSLLRIMPEDPFDLQWRRYLEGCRMGGERVASQHGGSCLSVLDEAERRVYPYSPEDPDEGTRRRMAIRHALETTRLLRRLAAGPHGFAALRPGGGAAAPELQQLLAFTLQPALDRYTNEFTDLKLKGWGKRRASEIMVPHLAERLSPQLLTCLLADVATGLLCPGCGARAPPENPAVGRTFACVWAWTLSCGVVAAISL
jgi:hypothetical protein